jgi:hypothetical protein
MAVSKLICPECKKVLKPTKPLPEGKKVTCPKCGANFAAKEPPPDPAAHPTKKAAAPAAPKPTAVKKAQQASKPIRPIEQRRHNLDDDEDEDEGGVYDFAEQPDHEGPEVEYTPDMSIKDLRGPAQAMLVKPSNYLIMAGVVGFFGWLGFMVIVLIPIIFPLQEKQPDDKNKQQPVQASPPAGARGGGPGGAGEKGGAKPSDSSFFKIWGINLAELAEAEWYWTVLAVLGFATGMLYSGIVTLGAVSIQNLESRKLGIISSIMAIIPLNSVGAVFLMCLLLQVLVDDTVLMGPGALLCVLSAAAGLGALYTLMRPEVIAGFQYKSD